jgi:hypothetical protein
MFQESSSGTWRSAPPVDPDQTGSDSSSALPNPTRPRVRSIAQSAPVRSRSRWLFM